MAPFLWECDFASCRCSVPRPYKPPCECPSFASTCRLYSSGERLGITLKKAIKSHIASSSIPSFDQAGMPDTLTPCLTIQNRRASGIVGRFGEIYGCRVETPADFRVLHSGREMTVRTHRVISCLSLGESVPHRANQQEERCRRSHRPRAGWSPPPSQD